MSYEWAIRQPREERDTWVSGFLAFLVHICLGTLLFFGVNWQTSRPAVVEVELYAAPPPAAVQPPPPPKPIEPPKPEVKPVPKPVEPEPVPKKADIQQKVVKPLKEEPKKPPKEEPKKEPPKEEPKKKDVTKPAPKTPEPPPAPAWAKELQATEQSLNRSKAADAANRELQQLKASQTAGARRQAEAAWSDRIRAAIKRYIVVPPGVKGNPEALFDVAILPDGTVVTAHLQKSTGVAALDSAIERAILKASPLPKPEDMSIFTRELKLSLRPLENRQE